VPIVGNGVGIDSTIVDTTATAFGPGGCPGHSAGGAIDKAVGGSWDQMAFVSAVVDAGPARLVAVKLRLARTDHGRCTYFSGRFERFRHAARCGAGNGFWFGVGSASTVDYLLPGALPRGRYVLDANAIDMAFNRDDARRRGANRIVFHVD
jgi:hypothetical protein